jgi:hypothetical protein
MLSYDQKQLEVYDVETEGVNIWLKNILRLLLVYQLLLF